MVDKDRESDFEKLIDDLQSRIDEDEAKVFSKTAIAEARDPSNVGVMEDADGVAERTGSCGDTMRIYVRLEGDRVAQVRFVTDGCGATTAGLPTHYLAALLFFCDSWLRSRMRGFVSR